jgi:hypothetical protein
MCKKFELFLYMTKNSNVTIERSNIMTCEKFLKSFHLVLGLFKFIFFANKDITLSHGAKIRIAAR